MKKYITYSVSLLLAAFALSGCADWLTPERKVVQHPDEQSPILRDDAYWQALREYKQRGDHKIAFGWYGSWTATGASYQSRLVSAPDSMDIISIWSQWHSLTPEQIADKEYVQKVKGTKVTFTTFLDNIPKEFRAGETPTEEEIAVFAKAWACDSIAKYNYDGMDIDYEPGYGASGPLVGNPCPELFNVLIRELGKYLGPKSGTGKLLMIDGVPYAVRGEMAEYFDYGIVQAYACTAASGYRDALQERFDNAYNVGWKPEQYIFAENFESYWQNGGVNHTTREGETVNSLLGMARFNPTQGFCAGFGAYHMEYEYAHHDMPYKYMRRAIQDVNPAGGNIVVSLASTSLSNNYILVNPDGTLDGELNASLSLNFSKPVPSDISFEVVLDNSLVESYNAMNGTAYQSLDPEKVKLAPVTTAAGAYASSPARIELDATGFSGGSYLIPAVVNLPADGIYSSREQLVYYVAVSFSKNYIEYHDAAGNGSTLSGTEITPVIPGWTINCYNGTNDSGANGVWNLDSDEQKNAMFDGSRWSDNRGYWYTQASQYNDWGTVGGNFIVTLDKAYDISGFQYYHVFAQGGEATVTDVLYSVDGKDWTSLTGGVEVKVKDSAGWKVFQFKTVVNAQYIRVMYGPLPSKVMVSMDEIDIYAPAN